MNILVIGSFDEPFPPDQPTIGSERLEQLLKSTEQERDKIGATEQLQGIAELLKAWKDLISNYQIREETDRKNKSAAERVAGSQDDAKQQDALEKYPVTEKDLRKELNKLRRYVRKKSEYEDRKANYDLNKGYFGPLCEAVGKALALRHHTIVLSVPYWDMMSRCNTVANYVAFGASKVERENKKPNKLILHIPQEVPPKDTCVNDTQNAGTKPKSLQGFRNLPHIALEEKFIPGKGEFKSKTIPNITEVDAVILIGGFDGTMNVGYAAYSLNKPCITVASVGGAAKHLFDDLYSFDYQRFVRQGIVKEQDIIALTASVQENDQRKEKSAYDIVRTTEKITSAYGIVNDRTRQVLWTILIGSLGLLAAWVHLFTCIGNDLKLPLQYSLSPSLLAGIVLLLDIWVAYVNFSKIDMMIDSTRKWVAIRQRPLLLKKRSPETKTRLRQLQLRQQSRRKMKTQHHLQQLTPLLKTKSRAIPGRKGQKRQELHNNKMMKTQRLPEVRPYAYRSEVRNCR